MATTTLAPSAAFRGGIRLFGTRRPGADLLALLVLVAAAMLALIASYAHAPEIEVGVATRYNTPHLQDFHEPEAVAGQKMPSYRWTQKDSTILAPSLGRGLWTAALKLSSPRPAGAPKQVVIRLAQQSWPVQLQAGPRTYHLLAQSRGDVSPAINAPLARYGGDPRQLGVAFFGASFESIVPSALPPTRLTLYTVIALLLAYLTLRCIGLSPRLTLILALIGLSILAWGAATHRAAIGLLVPRLSILAIAGLIGVWLVGWGWTRLMRLGQLDAAPWLLPALLTVFYVGFWIKAAGLLYPYSHAIDVSWHMQHVQDILHGRLLELYKPGAFSESVMPVKEWGANRPLIPYSPYFHILATSFAIFPWSLETTANVFSVFFDTNRVILIAALGLAFGLRSRGGFMAALLYAVTPFTFLLHSWGNIPTTFGIWWTLLATTLLVLTFGRWHERRIFILLAAVLLLTFLFYTVMAVFMGIFLVLLLIGLALFGRGLSQGQIRALFGATALAVGLSLVVYYGQYIPGMIARTLPYVDRTVVGGQSNPGQATQQPFLSYVIDYNDRLGYRGWPVRYGLWLPLLLAMPGLWLLRRHRLAVLIMGAWYLVALLFFVVGSRVSMVDKQLFYVAPALTLCTAAVLERVWARRRLLQGVIVSAYALTFLSALQLWIWRLQAIGQ